MKTNWIKMCGMAVLSVLAVSGVASAQTVMAPSGSLGGGGGYGGGYGGYGGYFSSTYEEGVLRGLGYLAASTGEANYYNSLAAINGQEATSRWLANQEKATETYFRLKQINKAARDAQRPQRLSPEQQVALARQQAPSGLNAGQYNRELGRLNWPAVLNSDVFAPERVLLDRVFMARSPADVGAASAFHSQVKQLSTAMEAKLKDHLTLMSPAEYMAAKKFVLGLSVESQQPMVFGALASN